MMNYQRLISPFLSTTLSSTKGKRTMLQRIVNYDHHQIATTRKSFATETIPIRHSSTSLSKKNKKDELVIGFIGLGNMGLPMCQNLLKSSSSSNNSNSSSNISKVIAYDTNPDSITKMIQSSTTTTNKEQESGGDGDSDDDIISSRPSFEIATSLSNLIQKHQPNVIITVLPDCNSSEIVISKSLDYFSKIDEDVVDEDCSSTTTTKTTTFIDCSTISVSTSRKNHETISNASSSTSSSSSSPSNNKRLYQMIDAPMSGGVHGAKEGTLTFMIGTSSSTIVTSMESIFMKMGNTMKLCGGPGNGIVAKLCNNLALATQMIGICEAMNLGNKLGMDPITLADCLNTSTASCWSSKVNNPNIDVATSYQSGAAKQNYDGGFGIDLMLKDLKLVCSEGENVNVALPLGVQSKELYQLCSLSGLGKKDFGIMLEFLRGGCTSGGDYSNPSK